MFGLAIATMGALAVILPARSEAKKLRNAIPQSTVNLKMPADSNALQFEKGTIRVRNGLILDGKPLKIKRSKETLILPVDGKLRTQKFKLQKLKAPKKIQIVPVK